MKISELTEAFRSAMVQVLVPEMKELKKEMNERFVAMHKEMDERFAAIHREMDERFAKVDERFAKVDERFEKMDEKFNKMMEMLVSIKVDISEMKARDKQMDWLMTRFIRLEEDMDMIKKKLAAA